MTFFSWFFNEQNIQRAAFIWNINIFCNFKNGFSHHFWSMNKTINLEKYSV